MTYLPQAVYVLCAVTSVFCMALMLRSWKRSQQRLLLFVGLCFGGLALNNVLLAADLILTPPSVDLALPRASIGLASMAGLLFALIWEGL